MKIYTSAATIAFLLCTASSGTFGQGSMGSKGSMGAMGSMDMSSGFDFKAASLADVKDCETKFVGLAKAIPADKYTWRPGDGVRSISEVFLHVISADYALMNMLGTPPPSTFNRQGYEKSTTDKAQIIDQLTQSFAFVESAIEKTPNSQLQKQTKMFGGKDAMGGDVLFLIITDLHEHLGQMISYARQNGVTPPWTAARQHPSGN